MSKIELTWLLHVASVSRDRALSSLLFVLKAKINYETPALSRCVNGCMFKCAYTLCLCVCVYVQCACVVVERVRRFAGAS